MAWSPPAGGPVSMITDKKIKSNLASHREIYSSVSWGGRSGLFSQSCSFFWGKRMDVIRSSHLEKTRKSGRQLQQADYNHTIMEWSKYHIWSFLGIIDRTSRTNTIIIVHLASAPISHTVDLWFHPILTHFNECDHCVRKGWDASGCVFAISFSTPAYFTYNWKRDKAKSCQ